MSVHKKLDIPPLDIMIHQLARDVAGNILFVKMKDDETNLSKMDLDEGSIDFIRKKCQMFIKNKSKNKSIKYEEQFDNDKDKKLTRTISEKDLTHNKKILKSNNLSIENSITAELIKETKIIGITFTFPNKKKMILFKKISKEFFVMKDHKKFMQVRSGIGSISSASLLKIPTVFDMIYYDEEIFIFNKYPFEELFKYYKIFIQDKKEVFDALKENKIIDDGDLEWLRDVVMPGSRTLRRFHSIKAKKIYEKKIGEIKKALIKSPIKGVQIKNNKLKFDSSKILIDFFSDDKLYSFLTEKRYTSNSKIDD